VKTSATTPMRDKIHPSQVRYIKLGEGGKWERECLAKRVIRYGFGSETPERFPWCQEGEWAKLTDSFFQEGLRQGVATRFSNETQVFFEDDGATLWITFIGERLWWGQLEPCRGDPRKAAQPHADGDGVWRPVLDGWRSTDFNGDSLTKDRLSGALTKLALFRGTSCNVDVADYVIRRINGEKVPEVERGIAAAEEMKAAVQGMMTLLVPHDFETLVDLVFSTTGWRRQGIVGKTQKALDLDILLPSTGERAFAQIKSRTNQAQLNSYIAEIDDLGPYDRMFFVYHSVRPKGDVHTDDERVTLIGPEKLSEMVLDAGLVNWLIRKVS